MSPIIASYWSVSAPPPLPPEPTLPLPSHCFGCGPGPRLRHGSGLRNRKVEVVLWVFIIFLLVIIGLLTYSHLQLLTSLNEEGRSPSKLLQTLKIVIKGSISIELDSARVQSQPPFAHRAGGSPVPVSINREEIIKDVE